MEVHHEIKCWTSCWKTQLVWQHSHRQLRTFLGDMNNVILDIEGITVKQNHGFMLFVNVRIERMYKLLLNSESAHTEQYLVFHFNHIISTKKGITKGFLDQVNRIWFASKMQIQICTWIAIQRFSKTSSMEEKQLSHN